MSRVIAFCFLLLASVLAYLHIDSLPAWAPFASDYPVNIANQADDALQTTEGSKPVKPLKNTAAGLGWLQHYEHIQQDSIYA